MHGDTYTNFLNLVTYNNKIIIELIAATRYGYTVVSATLILYG